MTRFYTTSIEDVWNDYPHKDTIDKNTFKKVIQTANFVLAQQIIETGEGYILPKRCGKFVIFKGKVDDTGRRYIDFHHYMSTGKMKYHTNKHSDGYFAGFRWIREYPVSTIPNAPSMKFKPARNIKRALAKAIKEKNTINKYYEKY